MKINFVFRFVFLGTIKLNGLNETIYFTLLSFEEDDYFYSEYREGKIDLIHQSDI